MHVAIFMDTLGYIAIIVSFNCLQARTRSALQAAILAG